MKAKTYWVYALSTLHVGTGRGTGFIDLPVAREKLTGWPLIPGSSIKGVLRNYLKIMKLVARNHVDVVFGKAAESGDNGQAGSLVFSDARIVCLPVRSFHGTFAWVSSPMALQRLQRDIQAVGDEPPTEIPQVAEDALLHASNSKVVSNHRAWLEDLDLNASEESAVTQWAEWIARAVFQNDATWLDLFQQRFVLVSDTVFNFLCEAGTEVNARIRINDETKIVERGALWYEESLPAETILAGIAWCDKVYGQAQLTHDLILNHYCREPLSCQVGGKASTGKGRVRISFKGRD